MNKFIQDAWLEAAYYIESNGEAAIVDPLREVESLYCHEHARDGAEIRYVLETHFHADFVSGHIDLAAKTGARIVFGPTAVPGYDAYVARDGEELKLGNVSIIVLHTPGHTMESTTYLLRDDNGKDYAIFTGDTLFIGDVGRPDLVQKVKAEITPDYLAGLLFDSLRNKIMPLANEVIVYPGSWCRKCLWKEHEQRNGGYTGSSESI
ncbi:MAG: MBL fold metallo-hydrolase [Ferruginibacter sp.]